jgi:exosortase A-associated hydrolase 2
MEAFFLQGSQGPLFSILYAASGRKRSDPLGLVYLPPFAEEMNRARRMAALQARRLAALGIDVLLLDAFGTGDSAGDFGEASWETWRQDVKLAMAWLRARSGGKVGLWGLRLGALLAADVAAEDPDAAARLLLWQPVLSGDRHLTQFLRLHLAANMGRGPERESTKELRARLASGEALEIAGYQLSSSLAQVMSGLKLQDFLERLASTPMDWLEVVPGDKIALPTRSQQLVDTLVLRDFRLRSQAVGGEPFWTIQEITVAPQFLRATDDMLGA